MENVLVILLIALLITFSAIFCIWDKTNKDILKELQNQSQFPIISKKSNLKKHTIRCVIDNDKIFNSTDNNVLYDTIINHACENFKQLLLSGELTVSVDSCFTDKSKSGQTISNINIWLETNN